MLIDLAKVTETYIPLAPYLFELFNLAEVRNKPKPGSMPSLDWSAIIKAPKEYLHGKVYQVRCHIIGGHIRVYCWRRH